MATKERTQIENLVLWISFLILTFCLRNKLFSLLFSIFNSLGIFKVNNFHTAPPICLPLFEKTTHPIYCTRIRGEYLILAFLILHKRILWNVLYMSLWASGDCNISKSLSTFELCKPCNTICHGTWGAVWNFPKRKNMLLLLFISPYKDLEIINNTYISCQDAVFSF